MTTDTTTRANTGGFEDRFRVTRTDGQPINAERRYIVLAYDGSDPAAHNAINAYAEYIESDNPQLAADFRDALANPTKYPAQHD
jgi:hypothetical protein